MTLFAHPDGVEAAPENSREVPDVPAVKRPSSWSVRNWPGRWKVVAIALVPMVLAVVFGGLRVSSALTDAGRLRLAADRAEMLPAITNYMSALGGALVAASSGGDAQGAKKNYENRKYELRSQLAGTDVATDVRSGVTSLVERGQGLLDRVSSNSIGLRDQVTGYPPILLTAEDTINGSVRVDNERIRAETEGLSRAVGARGQMMMQELLVNRGGELSEPELRTSMITLAGTEPSTLFGMNEVLGVDSPDAKRLHQQMVTRMAIMSDPASVLPNNPVLQDSIHSTDEIASRVINDTTGSVTKSAEDRAADRRNAAIRDTVLVLAAIAIALVTAYLMALSLVRPLRVLRDSALKIAHADLEHEIARMRAGDEREPTPLPVYTTDEIGQVAHAVDELHAKALLLAGDEARLRLLVNDMFETMSRRNRSLVDRQLLLIDRLERNEDDPDRLDTLFRLDHLASRMRRNGANLLVLAGAQLSHDKGRSVPLSTVISAAISEVEDYRRVQTAMVSDVTVTGVAAGDTVHLMAELIDNALRYSPPTAPVRVSAESAAVPRGREGPPAGVLVGIVDAGLGMTDADLRIANMRLSSGGEVTPEYARHMGLFVVSRLAHRHGIQVQLYSVSPAAQGITVEVYLPPSLLAGGTGADELAPHGMPAMAMSLASQQAAGGHATVTEAARNGSGAGAPAISLLPQRNPRSSGITDMPAAAGDEPPHRRRELPLPWWEKAVQRDAEKPSQPLPAPDVAAPAECAEIDPARSATAPTDAPAEDLIYQRMMSEWPVDPYELASSADLDWKSVWDHGWSVAAEVQNVPVVSHTEHGLPVREPGVRLVPGSVPSDTPGVRSPADEAAHHRGDPQRPVASNRVPDRPAHRAPERDPDAIRASISSHFGGVRAGRSHARETSPETDKGPDHE